MNQNIWGFPNIGSSTFEQALGYKTYVSLLNQSGVNPPTGTVLQNSLGVNITWQYIAPGIYFGNLDQNIFTSPDEYVTISGIWTNFGGPLMIANVIQVQVLFTNIIVLSSATDGVLADDLIGQTGAFNPPTVLEIRKYS